jgi:3-hydroxyacyl-CoA dehydrogenase
MPVVVREPPPFLDAARARVTRWPDGAVKRGKLDEHARAEELGRITFTSELTDLADADLVVEAVPEVLDLKLSTARRFAERSGKHGLDVVHAVCRSLYDDFGRVDFAPPLLKRIVGAGRLGQKSGRGFYEYDRWHVSHDGAVDRGAIHRPGHHGQGCRAGLSGHDDGDGRTARGRAIELARRGGGATRRRQPAGRAGAERQPAAQPGRVVSGAVEESVAVLHRTVSHIARISP